MILLKTCGAKSSKYILCGILISVSFTTVFSFTVYAGNLNNFFNTALNTVLNNSMSGSFKEGASFANSNLLSVIDKSKHTDPHSIPGFITDNPSETKDKVANIDDIGKQKNATDPYGQFVDNSYKTRKHQKIDKKDKLVIDANNIVKASSDTEKKSGNYSGLKDIDTHYDPSPDFKKAMSAMSAAASASKSIGKHQHCHWVWRFHPFRRVKVCDPVYYRIFDGSGSACRDYAFAYDNCCKDSGWGQKIGIAGCNETEHQLGLKKQAGVCHYVGRYCSEHWGHTHWCKIHSKTYCCFGSKLARIVQEQGRNQIRKGWGSIEYPDCSGFSPEQLQHIDFSKIDFRDFYNDLQKEEKIPDVSGTQGHADQTIQDDIDRGKPM